jgi:hypothetical protein
MAKQSKADIALERMTQRGIEELQYLAQYKQACIDGRVARRLLSDGLVKRIKKNPTDTWIYALTPLGRSVARKIA